MTEKDQEFAEILNNINSITFGQMLRIIKKIKYSAMLTVIAMFVSCVGSTFVAGQYSQQKDAAVMLESPFAMRLTLDNKKHDFSNLTLIKDPMSPKLSNKVVLSLREIKNEFDIVPLGKVVATVEEKDITYLWRWVLANSETLVFSNAYAKSFLTGFQFGYHAGDYKFKEGFVAKHVVHRFYSDGCILEYTVDNSRKSVHKTFRWIKYQHYNN